MNTPDQRIVKIELLAVALAAARYGHGDLSPREDAQQLLAELDAVDTASVGLVAAQLRLGLVREAVQRALVDSPLRADVLAALDGATLCTHGEDCTGHGYF